MCKGSVGEGGALSANVSLLCCARLHKMGQRVQVGVLSYFKSSCTRLGTARHRDQCMSSGSVVR